MNIGRLRDPAARQALPRLYSSALSAARFRSIQLHRDASLARHRSENDLPRPEEAQPERLVCRLRPGSNVRFCSPCGVAVDASGSVYIADSGNHQVRRIGCDGSATVVAGAGRDGFFGDGGPAALARLTLPKGVAIDGAGNLYIVDSGNRRIRKVTPQGTIFTVAGAGFRSATGEEDRRGVLKAPSGVALDRWGRLFIADSLGNRVCRVDDGGNLVTVAGGSAGTARLSQPHGIAVDASGCVYVADWGSHRILRVRPNGKVETVAGSESGVGGFAGDGGPATGALFCYPRDVAVDKAGALYIADSGNHRIRKIGPDGTVTTVAGTGTNGFSGDGGPAIGGSLHYPAGVALDLQGGLYIADSGDHHIRRVAPDGTIATVS